MVFCNIVIIYFAISWQQLGNKNLIWFEGPLIKRSYGLVSSIFCEILLSQCSDFRIYQEETSGTAKGFMLIRVFFEYRIELRNRGVSAWPCPFPLSSPQSPAANLEKQSEPHLHRDGRTAVSRRRHNSSDGFFNNGSLRAPTGQCWKPDNYLVINLKVTRSCRFCFYLKLWKWRWWETWNWHWILGCCKKEVKQQLITHCPIAI